jgi:hypothetical protein
LLAAACRPKRERLHEARRQSWPAPLVHRARPRQCHSMAQWTLAAPRLAIGSHRRTVPPKAVRARTLACSKYPCCRVLRWRWLADLTSTARRMVDRSSACPLGAPTCATLTQTAPVIAQKRTDLSIAIWVPRDRVPTHRHFAAFLVWLPFGPTASTMMVRFCWAVGARAPRAHRIARRAR